MVGLPSGLLLLPPCMPCGFLGVLSPKGRVSTLPFYGHSRELKLLIQFCHCIWTRKPVLPGTSPLTRQNSLVHTVFGKSSPLSDTNHLLVSFLGGGLITLTSSDLALEQKYKRTYLNNRNWPWHVFCVLYVVTIYIHPRRTLFSPFSR